MQVLELDETDWATGAGHRFVIEMNVTDDGPVRVKSCDVIGQSYRNRYTFPKALTVCDVFDKVLAAAVMDCLSTATPEAKVVPLPRLTIELVGLTLSDAHMITVSPKDGGHRVTLRFKTVLGCISNAFLPKLGIEGAVADHSEHMSAMVLTDIVMPLLDLCAIVEGDDFDNPDAFTRFLGTLARRSREVRFQAELIKRFVTASTGPDTPGDTGTAGQMFMKTGSLS